MAIALAISASSLAATASVTADDLTYLGPDGGGWLDALNWTGGVLPGLADTAIVNGPGGFPVSVQLIGIVNVGAVDIDADDAVVIANNSQLRVQDAIVNRGMLRIGATTGNSYIRARDALVTISGGGTIVMENAAWLDRTTVGGAFRNEDNTIRGSGFIGSNTTPMTNLGSIIADVPTRELRIDAPSGPATLVNQGLLAAEGGASLWIQAADVDNASGLIQAGAGSNVDLMGPTINGGTLATIGDGQILNSALTTLAGDVNPVVLDGTIVGLNNTQFRARGEIRNLDSLRLAALTGNTYLRAIDEEVRLTGGGTITMENAAWLDRTTVGGSIVNEDNLIHGQGFIGVNTTPFTNRASIIADVPGEELRIDPPTATPFLNESLLRAENGAILSLQAGRYENFGSLIEAVDGGVVRLQSAQIEGGTLRSANGGVIENLSTVTQTLGETEPVTIDGDLVNLNNTQLLGRGELRNLGSITLGATTGNTYVRAVDTELLLAGGGTITMQNSAWLDRTAVGGSIVNEDNLIHGQGFIGVNTTPFTNRGEIIADVDGGELRIDPPTGTATFVNEGVVRAVGQALLRLQPGEFDNQAGRIEVSDDALVELAGVTIAGGDLEAVGNGVFRSTSTTTTLDGTKNRVRIEGNVEIPSNTRIRGLGELENHGTITINPAAGNSYLRPLGAEWRLTGGGTVVLDGAAAWIDRESAGGAFINEDNLIRGSGRIGANTTPITNRGEFRADDPAAPMRIDPPASGGPFLNEGVLVAAAIGDGLDIALGDFTTSGRVVVEAGATMTRAGTMNQTAGATEVDGVLSISSGLFLIEGGVLSGFGNVLGDVTVTSGAVDPGRAGQAGSLDIMGDLSLSTGSTVRIDVAGPGMIDVDVIDAGTAFLDGTLAVTFVGGFEPPIGSVFTILTTAVEDGIVGTFAQTNCSTFIVRYLDNRVEIEVVALIRAEDLDCSGTVDFADLLVLLGAWGPCDGCPADLNGDGDVAFSDLLQLLAAFD